MSVTFHNGPMSCKLEDYIDCNLSEVRLENIGEMFIYDAKDGIRRNNIMFGITTDDIPKAITIKSIDNVSNEKEIIDRINTIFPSEARRYIVRTVIRGDVLVMDTFTHDLSQWLNDIPARPVTLVEQLMLFILRVSTYLRLDGQCFTDLKLSQFLIRPVKSCRSRHYHTILYNETEYELALTDLDMRQCKQSRHVYTYNLPPLVSKMLKIEDIPEKKFMWAFVVTILQILDNCPKISTDPDVKDVKNWITCIHSSQLNANYKNILFQSLDVSIHSWEVATKGLFLMNGNCKYLVT